MSKYNWVSNADIFFRGFSNLKYQQLCQSASGTGGSLVEYREIFWESYRLKKKTKSYRLTARNIKQCFINWNSKQIVFDDVWQ